MVLEMLGGAMAYAYQYNMGRFQFDSGQSQAGAFQTQNLRLAQWGLFREDCRDLFGITTNNMQTYMLISTLFLGFTFNFAWNRVVDIPMDPGWLMIFFNNCMYASILYGMLSVWLAMHGTISAHTAGVKVLTQAVRPPIPSAAEVAMVGFDLAKYEAAGPAKMFRAPALLKKTEEPNSPGIPGGAVGSKRNAIGSFASRASRLRGDDEAQRAQELLHNNEMGGPGESASVGNHIHLFRQLQATYVPFESYARVSLLLATHHMLMCSAYFFVAYYMVGYEGKATPSQNVFSAWAAVFTTITSSMFLFKLDLFVGGPVLRIVKLGVSAAPMIGALGANLWVHNADWIKKHQLDHPDLDDTPVHAALPQCCAVLAGLLHLSFELLVVWQARPDHNKAGLPMNFRSVQYIDIFGWWDDHYQPSEANHFVNSAVQENEAATPALTQRTSVSYTRRSTNATDRGESQTRKAQKEARDLARTIKKLKEQRMSAHMTDAEMAQLEEIQSALEDGVESLELAESDPTGAISSVRSSLGSQKAPLYLRCLHATEHGQEMPCFVNCTTGEVHWDDGNLQGNAIDLKSIHTAVAALQERRESGSSEPTPQPVARTSSAPASRASAAGTRRVSIGGDDPRPSGSIELPDAASIRSRSPIQNQNSSWRGEPNQRSRSTHSATSSYNGFDDAAPPIFAEMPRRSRHRTRILNSKKTDSKHSHSSMPWKYFAQAASLVALLWASTTIWTLIHMETYYEGTMPPRPDSSHQHTTDEEQGTAELAAVNLLKGSPKLRQLGSNPFFTQLPVVWPHKFFRPSAVACSGKALVLGDEFAIHTAEPLSTDSALHIRQLLAAGNLPSQWRALAVIESSSENSTCPALLLLERSGRAVAEIPLCQRAGSLRPTARRWLLGQSLDAALHSIAPMDSKVASGLCGPDSAPWALHAVSERGEVIALCAREGQIEPMHMVLAAPKRSAADEYLGLQLDENGMLWVLSQAQGSSQTELNAYAMEGGIHRGKWQLPSGRSWANGLCGLSGERGFFLASKRLSSGLGAHPEVWRFDNSTSQVIVAAKAGFLPQ